jgi:hypothetical protein
MGIDGYFRVSMGILQNVNYGSPKSRNVRLSRTPISGGNFLHSRGLGDSTPDESIRRSAAKIPT